MILAIAANRSKEPLVTDAAAHTNVLSGESVKIGLETSALSRPLSWAHTLRCSFRFSSFEDKDNLSHKHCRSPCSNSL